MRVDVVGNIETYAEGFLGASSLDETMTIRTVSDGVLAISGYDRDEVVGKTAADVLHHDDLERAGAALLELARTRVPTIDGIYRMKWADGTFHEYAIRAVTAEHDGVSHLVLQFSEASPVLRIEEFTRDVVETLRMLAEHRQLDECLERVHVLAERHVPGIRLAISTLLPDSVRTHRRLPDRTYRMTEGPSALPDHVQSALARHLEGPWRAFSRMAEFEPTEGGGRITSVLTNDNDEVLGYVEAIRDALDRPDEREWMVHGTVRQVLAVLLQRVRLDEQLREAADHDPLTGLANRRRLFNDMAARDDLGGTSLLLIDLDRFAWINNHLGHHVGDQTLVAVANHLREQCPGDATIARFGGDEFVVWTPTPVDDIEGLDGALRAPTISAPGIDDRRASVRCSIGVVSIRPGESATDAIVRADEAMYVAKARGGDGMHLG